MPIGMNLSEIREQPVNLRKLPRRELEQRCQSFERQNAALVIVAKRAQERLLSRRDECVRLRAKLAGQGQRA